MTQMDPALALRRLGGIASGTTLRQHCNHWEIRVAVRDGRIERLVRNRYALPGRTESLAAAARLHGVASHLSAAMFWGWKVKHAPDLPVVTVPRGRKVHPGRRQGVDLRWAVLPVDDTHRDVATTRVRTVVDCARTLPFDEALCVADSALREGRIRRDQIVLAAEQSPRQGRTRALAVVAAADGRAANPFESCLRAICLQVPGLGVEPQLVVPGIGHADLGDARLGLLIEADSYEFHAERAAFRYDIRRYTMMARRGWTVVRFCWEDVMHRPEQVAAALTDLVALLSPCGQDVHCCGTRRHA